MNNVAVMSPLTGTSALDQDRRARRRAAREPAFHTASGIRGVELPRVRIELEAC